MVNATSTLALGIHIPCKSVVFAGDSSFLNSLQYRQVNGRYNFTNHQLSDKALCWWITIAHVIHLFPSKDKITQKFTCYFQMSGRAGRRGFDPVGNVIFFGIPYCKVQRLMTANIPKLVGNFPITVSLVLRLLLMTTQADDKEDALTKVWKNVLRMYS